MKKIFAVIFLLAISLVVFIKASNASTELVTNKGFEQGTLGWVFSGNMQADSRFPNAHIGSSYAYLSEFDGDPGNGLTGRMYQNVVIPSNISDATLSFWYNITSTENDSLADDILKVTIQSSTGAYLETVAVYSDLNKDVDSGNPYYHQKTFDMTAYKGQTVRINFLSTTDYALPTVFRIDDVSLTYEESVVSEPEELELWIEEIICDSMASAGITVKLDWNDVSDYTIVKYNIYRNGYFYINTLLDSYFYNSANLIAGNTYTYRIEAVNSSGGLVAESNMVTANISPNICNTGIAPGSFTLSHIETKCDTNYPEGPAIGLNWNPASGATSYHVYRNGSLYENVATDITFYNSANVTAGQTYTYYIQARNANGNTNSNSVSVYVRSDICDSPPFLHFEIDFNQIDYGNVMLMTQASVIGDLFFDPSCSNEPTVKNNSTSNLNILIQQDDMGFGSSNLEWNVQYRVRIGNSGNWTTYSPYEIVELPLQALQTDSINFGVSVNKILPSIDDYQGILTINDIEVGTQLSKANTYYFCGNGIIEGDEECDNNNFGGQSCEFFGFDSGNLSCNNSCQIITSDCSLDDDECDGNLPTITLVNTVINDDGGTAQSFDFQIKLNSYPVQWNHEIIIDHPEIYYIWADEKSGYKQSGWSGDCSTNGKIDLQCGDKKTCYITHDDEYTDYEWINIKNSNTTYSIAVDPITPTTLYVGLQGGVYKSTNSGDSWNTLNTGSSLSARFLAIDPMIPTTLYAGIYGDGIYKSTNGGDNWNTINIGLDNIHTESFAIDPITPTTLYVGTAGGVHKSTNGGNSWSTINIGLYARGMSLAIDPFTPTTLYVGTDRAGVHKSTNGGDDWSAVNTGLDSAYINSIVIDPFTPTTLYVGARGGVYKSTNGGDNWNIINIGWDGADVTSFAIDPLMPTTVYAGTYRGGVYKSTNGGDSWNTINIGLSHPYIHSLAIDPLTPTILYAGTSGGMYKYTGEAISPPALSYSNEFGYDDGSNDPFNTNFAVHPDKVAAKKDLLTFKAVYTGDMAPNDIRITFKHEKDFTTDEHLHEMVYDFDLREKLVWKDISDIYPTQTGRILGMSANEDGFDEDESIELDIPGNNKSKVSLGVITIDSGWGWGSPEATLKLEALNKNNEPIDSVVYVAVLDDEDVPDDVILSVQNKEGLIDKVRFSVSNTDESEAWIQSLTTFEELEMTPDSLATTTDPLLKDNDFSNGEQYVATSTFSRGNYSFSITASSTDGQIVRLPETGNLTFFVKELFVYVALGDSYQSGEGIGSFFPDTQGYEASAYENGVNYPYAIGGQENTYHYALNDVEGNACHRSLYNYAKLNRDKLKPEVDDDAIVLIDRTCSGATISNGRSGNHNIAFAMGPNQALIVSEEESQIGYVVKRLKELGLSAADVNLVTVGMGGNDAKFSTIVKACVVPQIVERLIELYEPEIEHLDALLGKKALAVESCKMILDYNDAFSGVDEAIKELSNKEIQAQQKLLDNFSSALVLQLNYPNITPSEKPVQWCGGIRADDFDTVEGKVEEINGIIESSVNISSEGNSRFKMVDISSSLGDNPICPTEGGDVLINSINKTLLDNEINFLLNNSGDGDKVFRDTLDKVINLWNTETYNCFRVDKIPGGDSCDTNAAKLKLINLAQPILDKFSSEDVLQLLLSKFIEIPVGAKEAERKDRTWGLFHPTKKAFAIFACYVEKVFKGDDVKDCKISKMAESESSVDGESIQYAPIPSVPGQDVNIHFAGFKPNSSVEIVYLSAPIYLGDVLADDNGIVDTNIKLPDTYPGVHTLELRGVTADDVGIYLGARFNYDGRPVGDETYATYLCGLTANVDGGDSFENVDIFVNGEYDSTLIANEDGCVLAKVWIYDSINQSEEIEIFARNVSTGKSVNETIIPIPSVVGFWALKSEYNSLAITGNKNNVIGKIHSEASIVVKGNQNIFGESPEYVADIIIKGNKHIIPEGRKVEPGGLPRTWVIDDYRPGGFLALEAGDSYHVISENSCIDGLWSVDAKDIPDGIVYVPCSVEIYGSDEIINATIVSDGSVLISGSRIILGQNKPGVPAVLTSYNKKDAFRISGANNQILGTVQALEGGVRIVGSKGLYRCGIIAQTIKIEGSNNEFVVDEECRER